MNQTSPRIELPKPSPELELFHEDVGIWDTTTETRTAPGAAPQISRGVSTHRLACGGMWLLSDFKNENGFEGHGFYGFDPAKKKYTGVWLDPLRTFVAVLEGTYDHETRTMTMWGELQRPDGKPMRWRETTERVDPDTRIFRSFMPSPGGAEFEMMTVTYKRRA